MEIDNDPIIFRAEGTYKEIDRICIEKLTKATQAYTRHPDIIKVKNGYIFNGDSTNRKITDKISWKQNGKVTRPKDHPYINKRTFNLTGGEGKMWTYARAKAEDSIEDSNPVVYYYFGFIEELPLNENGLLHLSNSFAQIPNQTSTSLGPNLESDMNFEKDIKEEFIDEDISKYFNKSPEQSVQPEQPVQSEERISKKRRVEAMEIESLNSEYLQSGTLLLGLVKDFVKNPSIPITKDLVISSYMNLPKDGPFMPSNNILSNLVSFYITEELPELYNGPTLDNHTVLLFLFGILQCLSEENLGNIMASFQKANDDISNLKNSVESIRSDMASLKLSMVPQKITDQQLSRISKSSGSGKGKEIQSAILKCLETVNYTKRIDIDRKLKISKAEININLYELEKMGIVEKMENTSLWRLVKVDPDNNSNLV